MSNTNPKEKQQSVWSLAMAISLTFIICSPREITAQNPIAQGLIDTIEVSWQAAINHKKN